jgi:hypothetical protein
MKTAYYILLTTALTAAIWNRRALPRRVWLFIPILVASIAQVLIADLAGTGRSVQIALAHVYQFIELPLIAGYFFGTIRSRKLRFFILAMVPLMYIAAAVFYWQFPEKWTTRFFPEQSFNSIVIVFGTLVVFYEIYTDDLLIDLKRSPDFWLGMGNIIFFAGYLMAMGAYNYVANVIKDPGIAKNMILISQSLNLLLYFLYTVAFLCPKRTTISSS